MIDTALNLLFRCSHKRLTRPVTPVSKVGVPNGATYVVCLDCGKQFAYDAKEMRMGKVLPAAQDSGVIDPNKPQRSRLKFAFWASIPLAVFVGSTWKGKPKPVDKKPETGGLPR